DFILETIANTNKGIDYVLENDIKLKDTVVVDLDDQDFKTLNVHMDYWGLFEKVTATSQIKSNRFRKIALVGASQPEMDRMALYLEDQNKPLVVVGNTKIKGLAYVPKQGVRTGNISGHSYYGDQLVYGQTRISKELYKPLKGTFDHIKNMSSAIDAIDTNQFLDLKTLKIHQNSFFDPVQVIYSLDNISLSEVSLTGHILVQSKTKITVDASAMLK